MGMQNLGFAGVAERVGIGATAAYNYVANGSDNTGHSAAHTTLIAENSGSGLDRALVTPTRVQTAVANDTLQLAKVWTASGSGTINEVGVFNASSGGTMLARTVTAATRTITSGDTYSLTYKVAFA